MATSSAVGPRAFPWDSYLERYRTATWRGPIWRDMVLKAIADAPARPRVLDIGCGLGFDDDLRLQTSIAAAAGSYVGVEPAPEIPLAPYFEEAHRCYFEDAPLAPNSFHVAFAVMVLEHLPDPARFWSK